MSRAPMPPAVTGTLTPGLQHATRIVWWSQRGYRHGITHGPVITRPWLLVMWSVSWLVLPLSVLFQIGLLSQRHARYYMTPEADCVLRVAATRTGWHIADHIASHPGQRRGKKLRDAVLPVLRAAADHHGVVVHTTAVNQTMAATYIAELPGLLDVGRGYPRGRKLHREPRPAPGTAPSSSTRFP